MTTEPEGTPGPTSRPDVLTVLYPWYKEEVFRRRELMMRLTGFGGTIQVFLLITLLIIPVRHPATLTMVTLSATAVALFTALFVYLILQQQERHRLAKQVLIKLEQELGLYEAGSTTEGSPLYPAQWQTDWQRDRSVVIYTTILWTLGTLVIAAIIARAA